ncbi:MAG: nucleotidyltransferase family protein [Candidatus Omnitrophica bacterium]|nr:nucleotidyltransferase family protein [Candidatus Omnitrophota bacterium]
MNRISDHEYTLLCACCSSAQTPRATEAIASALNAGVSWDRLLSEAHRQEITPLVYYSLKHQAFQGLIPQAIMSQLHGWYLRNMQRNLMLLREMNRALEECNTQNIPVLFFKGLPLAFTLYPDCGLRYMVDIDLAVHTGDLAKAVDIFKQCGYVFTGKYAQEQQTAYAGHYEVALQKNVNARSVFIVEVHTALIPARPFPLTLPMWERAVKWDIDGRAAYRLSDEDALLISILHMRKHIRRATLKSIADIARFLDTKAGALDWRYIEQAVRDNRMRTCMYLGLRYAVELLYNETACRYAALFGPGAVKRRLISWYTGKTVFFRKTRARGILLRMLLFDHFRDFVLYIRNVMIRERFMIALQTQRYERSVIKKVRLLSKMR